MGEASSDTRIDPGHELERVLAGAAEPGISPRADSPRPTRQLVVITCMDARIDAHADVGLPVGEAHVIRVAGARIGEDVLRSLHLSTALLGTRGCLVLGHTDCGLQDHDGTLRDRLRSLDPLRNAWGEFTDPEQAVRDDVAALLAWPGAPSPWAVAGGVVDVTDGAVRTVVPPTTAPAR